MPKHIHTYIHTVRGDTHTVRGGRGRSGAVDRASDFGPKGPWFDSPPVHISLWP